MRRQYLELKRKLGRRPTRNEFLKHTGRNRTWLARQEALHGNLKFSPCWIVRAEKAAKIVKKNPPIRLVDLAKKLKVQHSEAERLAGLAAKAKLISRKDIAPKREYSNGELTKQDLEVLKLIKQGCKQNGVCPTLRELGEAMGCTPNAMLFKVRRLERHNLVSRKGLSRCHRMELVR